MQVNSTEGPILRDITLKPFSWFRIEFLILRYFFISLALLFVTHDQNGLNTGSAWVGQDYALPRGHLWPEIPVSVSCVRPPALFPFRSRSAEQPQEQNVLFLLRSGKRDNHIVPFLALSLSVYSHLSTSLQSTVQGRRQGLREGRASIVLPLLSCLSLAFLTCVPLVYPFLLSCPLPEEFLQLCSVLPALPGRPLPPHSLKWKRGMRPLGRPPSDCARGPRWVLHWVFLEPCLVFFCTH